MRKLNFIKIFIIIVVLFGFFGVSLALEPTSAGTDELGIFTHIVDLLNIIWLPFAIIAGKLFTNDLVYGSFLGMDTMLWKIWQFSKTVANYAIAIILFISIFMYFFGKVKDIFTTIGKLVLASVLVNASWFLISVLIDLSTILLVAVGSLPMHLIGTSATGPIEKIKYCSVIEIDPSSAGNMITNKNITVCKKGTEKQIDSSVFFQKMTNMSGPLVYIGTSILNIDKNWGIDKEQVNGNKSIKKGSGFRNMLHILVVILFIVPIILLVIIGLVRLFYLWIYIAFSPLIFLDYVFGGRYVKDSRFKVSNMIGLIFQPVIIVMAMSISLIFLATVQTSFIGGDNNESSKAKIELGICGENKLCINGKPVVTVAGNMMKNFMEDVGGAFGYLAISILTFILMWGMIKIAFTSSEITASIANAGFKFAEEGIKAVPLLPTPTGGVGIGAMQQFISNRLIKRGFDEKATKQAENIISKINNIFGTGQNSIGIAMEKKYQDELVKNTRSWKNLQEVYKEFLEDVKNNKPDIIPEVDKYFKQVTYTFFNLLAEKDNNLKNLMKRWGENGKKLPKNADELFANREFQVMLTGLIKNPNLLDNIMLSSRIREITAGNSNLLGYRIKDI